MAVIRGLKGIVKVPVNFKLLSDEDEVLEISFNAHFERRTRSKAKDAQSEHSKSMNRIMKLVADLEALKAEADAKGKELSDKKVDAIGKKIEAENEKSDRYFRDALVGWDSLKDDEYQDTPFSVEDKEALFDSQPYYDAIYKAYRQADGSIVEVLEKN